VGTSQKCIFIYLSITLDSLIWVHYSKATATVNVVMAAIVIIATGAITAAVVVIAQEYSQIM